MPEQRQKILLLGFGKYPRLKDHFQDFLSTIHSKPKVLNNDDLQSVAASLRNGSISAVVIFEPSVMEEKNNPLRAALIKFTKSGGTTVFAGLCSGLAHFPNINNFFLEWDLPWKSGSYTRSTFAVNPHARLDLRAKIASSCCIKALHLTNVAAEDLLYVSTDNSQSETLDSLVGSSGPWKLVGEGPIVFAQYHGGRIGWIGDVNFENETTLIMCAMLGL